MASISSQLPDYHSNLFVNRETELDEIVEKVRALLSASVVNGRVPKRTTVFTGVRGAGKSWLLAHFREQLRSQFPEEEAIILFCNLDNHRSEDPIQALMSILTDLAQQQLRASIHGAEPSQLSRGLADLVHSQLDDGRVLVMLLDAVYELDWNFLRYLEEYLLAPLITHPRALLIMTGRGKEYPWATPQLRFEAETYPLEPFAEVDDTEKQLEKQWPSARGRAERIHDDSGGIPAANYLLAAANDLDRGVANVLDQMLLVVPEENRSRIRECVEALSVLNGFDEDRIRLVMAAYDTVQYTSLNFQQAALLRRELVDLRFARWDGVRGAYVLDDTLRHFAQLYLQRTATAVNSRLHSAAEKLYRAWAADFPELEKEWREEAQYHARCLSRIEGGDNDRTGS